MIKKSTENILKYFKKDLFQVIFHVTFKCNARCKFCFNWEHLNQKDVSELSLEEIKLISNSMPDFPWLLLSGGEPIVREDLVDLVGIFYKNNKIKHLTLPTNGLLPKRIFEVTKDLLDKYKNLSVTVSFSLDAIGDAHDDLRGVKGCYDKLLESYALIEPLRENKKLNVKFNTVLGNFNCKDLENLTKEIRKLKPDMHTIDFIRGDDGLTFKNLKFEDLDLPSNDELIKIKRLIERNYDYYNGYSNVKEHFNLMQRVSKIIQKEYLSLFTKIITQKDQVIPCLAYRLSLVLYPYGDVSFCEPLKPFANFRDFSHDYRKIIQSDMAKRQMETIKNKRCVCYHPCYQYLNILFTPRLMVRGFLKDVF